MNMYLNGFDRKEVTFKANASVSEGATLKLMSTSTVAMAPENTDFIGVCALLRDKAASVVIRGYVRVNYTGTDPVLGYNKLVADGNGGVKVSESGRSVLVADVDRIGYTCGIIIN